MPVWMHASNIAMRLIPVITTLIYHFQTQGYKGYQLTQVILRAIEAGANSVMQNDTLPGPR